MLGSCIGEESAAKAPEVTPEMAAETTRTPLDVASPQCFFRVNANWSPTGPPDAATVASLARTFNACLITSCTGGAGNWLVLSNSAFNCGL